MAEWISSENMFALINNISINTNSSINGTDDNEERASCGNPFISGTIILIIMFFAGLGNGLVIGSSYLDREIRQGGLLPMVSLAITDLVFAEFSCTIMFVKLVCPSCHIPDHVCTGLGIVELSLVITVMYQHSLLAFSRYVAICYPTRYKALFKRQRVLLGLTILFVMSFIAVLIPSIVVANPLTRDTFMKHTYDVSMLICTYTVTLENMIYSGLLYFFVPVSFGSFCYLRCIIKLHGATSLDSSTSRHMKIAATMVVTYCLVLINSIPFPVVGLIFFSSTECSLVKRHLSWLILANSCCNPVVYAWKCSKFRRMFAQQLGCTRFLASNNAVADMESTVTMERVN